MQSTTASPAKDDRAATMTSGRRTTGAGQQAEARGLEIVRLHQTLQAWRARCRLAHAKGWPTLAEQIIGIEIRSLEREIARHVRELNMTNPL